jgi:hypothetical protein
VDHEPARLSLSVLLDPRCVWATDDDELDRVAETEFLLAVVTKSEKLYEEAGILRKSARSAAELARAIRDQYGGFYGI